MDAFEAWLEHLFDRGPGEFDWYLGDSRPTEWTLRYEEGDTPGAQAERIRRLFSDAGTLLRPPRDHRRTRDHRIRSWPSLKQTQTADAAHLPAQADQPRDALI
jgi:hypothetical protein